MEEVAQHVPVEAVIDGNYRIVRELGRGGMGYVYEAQGPTNRWAIKCLRPDLSSIDDAVRRFQNEARVPGLVRHRNLVQIYEIKNDPNWGWFMVMELLEGETLAERLVRVKRLTALECARMLLPCMRAIAKAHSLGIIHRDLKPHNIFLCRPDDPSDSEHPKVFDFGVMAMIREDLKFDSKITVRGTLIGTPPYMCVEQMCGEPATPHFDIHAFAVIMYEVVTGQLPFASQDELGIEVRFVKPIAPAKHMPELDPDFSALIMRALSRDRKERFATLQQMIDAFSVWLAEATQPGRAPASAASKRLPSRAPGPAAERRAPPPLAAGLAEPAPSAWTAPPAWVVLGAFGALAVLFGSVFAFKTFSSADSSEQPVVGVQPDEAAVQTAVHSARNEPTQSPEPNADPLPDVNTSPVFDPAALPRGQSEPKIVTVGKLDVLPASSGAANQANERAAAEQLHGADPEVQRPSRSAPSRNRDARLSSSEARAASKSQKGPETSANDASAAAKQRQAASTTRGPQPVAAAASATPVPQPKPAVVNKPAAASPQPFSPPVAAAPQPAAPAKPKPAPPRLIDLVLKPAAAKRPNE